jgi:hypothetical protein
MKIRQGFVSNSSTTSFCIYGIKTTKDFDYKKVKELGLEEYGSRPYDDDCNHIGISWYGIKDDETGLQFKNRVEKLIEEAGFDEQCYTYEDAWYDG